MVLTLGRVASMMMRAGVAAPVGRPAPRGRPYSRPLDRRYRRHRRVVDVDVAAGVVFLRRRSGVVEFSGFYRNEIYLTTMFNPLLCG